MSETSELLRDELEIDFYDEIESLIKKSPWAWQSIGGVLGLVGGVLSPVLGTLLIAVAWFIDSPEFSILHIICIGLFALTIPLLVTGSHCLDLLERKTSEVSVYARRPEKTLPQSLAYAAKGRRIVGVSKQPAR